MPVFVFNIFNCFVYENVSSIKIAQTALACLSIYLLMTTLFYEKLAISYLSGTIQTLIGRNVLF